MDERFFVYMDDVDLCRRLREGGWHVWYDPASSAVHYMGQSHLRETGSVSPRALRTFNRYYALHHSVPATVLLKVVEGTGHGVRAALYAGAALATRGRSSHRGMRSMARAHWTYCRTSLEASIER
jgi:GT2 family glycosyltransferase